ncbi:MAG: toxin-antitoxin system protein [Gemmatimonadota bacterium]|nr:toxin-antitoxin system protein [Gemmatimonadota bacterium]
MPTTRISESDHKALQELARRTGKQQQEIIHEALDTYQREKLLDEINAGFERLRSRPGEWKAEMDERGMWENTVADGLTE